MSRSPSPLTVIPAEVEVPSLPLPLTPLAESYTYHSPKPTTTAKYVLGVDEAGRGPVLGPLVYAVAYCPLDYLKQVEDMGFKDSKVLTAETRTKLLGSLCSDPETLGWSTRIICPQAISSGMLRRPPINLNRQSEEATVLLIREVLAAGIDLAEVYVDALGPSPQYQAYLSGLFPTISFTVCPKADALFAIVSAASVAAKVTRDAWMERWIFSEPLPATEADRERGSGYPSDPKTQAYLRDSLDPTFGFPDIVRFSWTTVKNILDSRGHAVEWTDEGQASLIKSFESAKGRDRGRCGVAKELGLRSVGAL